ncbi:hypothetical protein GYMLUDRAFT_37789 [Collybiopsis luxurians FD-317 M1]|nr:hypothetical protein GYMLUDRAFT_37789 [Collybiopsis luxurians FD-317 M1]
MPATISSASTPEPSSVDPPPEPSGEKPSNTMTVSVSPSTPSKKREKLVPKTDLTLNLKGLDVANTNTNSSSPASSPNSSGSNSSPSSKESELGNPILRLQPRTPRMPSPRSSSDANPLSGSTPRTPHYGGVTPCTPRYTTPSRTPRTPSSMGRYPPRARTPRTPGTAATWVRERGFLPTVPERCSSVPLGEDWTPQRMLAFDGVKEEEAGGDIEDPEDTSNSNSTPSEGQEDSLVSTDSDAEGYRFELGDDEVVELYDDDYREDYWGEPELTREEYMLMLEDMRKEAEISVCEGMMEQLELREAFEKAVDEMTRVRPDFERGLGLSRRRTIG